MAYLGFRLACFSASVAAPESSSINWTISAQRKELYVSFSIKGQELPASLANVINCHLSGGEELWPAGFSDCLVCLASPTRLWKGVEGRILVNLSA